jgi:hypothetical protein
MRPKGGATMTGKRGRGGGKGRRRPGRIADAFEKLIAAILLFLARLFRFDL